MGDKSNPYVVRQGDYLEKLAFTLGFEVSDVWDDPANQDLKTLRGTHDILLPGDILYLPTQKPPPVPLQGGSSNDYVAEVPSIEIVLVLKDTDGNLVANEPYEVEGLVGVEGDAPPPTTDGDAKLTLKVPVTLREVLLHLPQRNVTFQVMVGDMDPIVERSGIQKRLQNMGFGYFFPEDDPDQSLADAVRAFQAKNGLSPTGKVDDDTRNAILAGHGI